MSGKLKGLTPILELRQAVDEAIRSAPKPRRSSGKFTEKLARAAKPTKREREAFMEKYVHAACFDVRYHIQPVGDGFEIWDTMSNAVLGKFETLRSAQRFVERGAP